VTKNRLRSTLIALLMAIATLLGVAAAAPAGAADAYRYWIYWDAGATGPWIFATKAADAMVPKDGTVDGWRFAIAGEPQDTVRAPRIQPDFEAICGSTPVPPAGQKRVALVLDYGTEADSPDGTMPPEPAVECAVVPEKASSAQVLAATGRVRVEDTLICAIDGYPAAGCGDVVPNAVIPPTSEPTMPVPVVQASASATSTGAASTGVPADQTASSPADSTATGAAGSGSSVPWAPIIAVVVIVVLGVAGVAISRRNRE